MDVFVVKEESDQNVSGWGEFCLAQQYYLSHSNNAESKVVYLSVRNMSTVAHPKSPNEKPSSPLFLKKNCLHNRVANQTMFARNINNKKEKIVNSL